jgi:hypothetical protein
LLETILNKLSIKEIGNHLSNYANLYVKPIETWKKAIDLRTSSYNFIILNIVYFTILLMLMVRDTHLAIQLCLLEVIITIFPFLIFIIPCKIFAFLFKKKILLNRLFRLFLILKFQFITIFFLLFKFANYTQSEDSFILVDNFIWIIWIGFIVIFPMISNLKFIEKIIWIILNYMTFIIFFILLITVFSKINLLGNLGEEIMLLTPDKEYSNNSLKLSKSTLLINDKELLLIGKLDKNNIIIYKKTQFVDLELSILFGKFSRNNIIKKIIKNDSIICSLDKKRISRKDSLEKLYDNVDINIDYLDSIRNISIENIQKDIKLTDSIFKNSKFKSNKDYFKALNKYLIDYFDSYSNEVRIKKIIKNCTNKEYFQLSNFDYATIIKVNDIEYLSTKEKFEELKEKIEGREKKSNFLMNILFFPLEYFMENYY